MRRDNLIDFAFAAGHRRRGLRFARVDNAPMGAGGFLPGGALSAYRKRGLLGHEGAGSHLQ
jgi:hypothetical protein